MALALAHYRTKPIHYLISGGGAAGRGGKREEEIMGYALLCCAEVGPCAIHGSSTDFPSFLLGGHNLENASVSS